MCRLLLYKGKQPIQLAHLLTKPAHSIINQSFDSRLRIDRRRPINGDGFGVGWYEPDADSETANTPCIFTSVTPAWNNNNLIRLAEKIKSPLVFAHVRASTAGTVTETNCHPFQYGRLMFMHNGGVAQFDRIKRRLISTLKEDIFLFVQGSTDSEWSFALFLNFLKNPDADSFDYIELKEAMLKTISQLNEWADEAGITEPSLLNFAVTDGESVVCARYVSSDTLEAPSLYFSSGTKFESYEPGHYRMVKADRREDMVVVASEPLTFEKADWLTIPTNTILVITPKLSVLLSPIKDKYYRADPLGRSADAPVVGPGVHATGEEDTITTPEKSETISNLNAVCNTTPCRSLYRNRDTPAPKIPARRKPSLSTNDSDNSESDSTISLPDDDEGDMTFIEGGPRSLYPKGNAVPRAHHSRNLFRDMNPRNTKRGTPAVQAL
ncbi:nucleophile aminohydrolase [Umbelopsis sp. AD052]|nr:nucleophile aminohydrolase [Umbelopsis sp. AD052]